MNGIESDVAVVVAVGVAALGLGVFGCLQAWYACASRRRPDVPTLAASIFCVVIGVAMLGLVILAPDF